LSNKNLSRFLVISKETATAVAAVTVRSNFYIFLKVHIPVYQTKKKFWKLVKKYRFY